LSAATGIAIAFALIRGFARQSSKGIGNFWVDMTRSTLYVLLPLSVVFALVLVQQGSIQNFRAYQDVKTLEVTNYTVPKLDA
ncbi:potassium-transporting ATPase subunit KdpA, partial [Salmonella enterica]|uniref:potassium-transporting ATPase subunit KdpA n=1 Tax=Salmonella enterica TaxID=28901 RepID=UPI003CFAECBA